MTRSRILHTEYVPELGAKPNTNRRHCSFGCVERFDDVLRRPKGGNRRRSRGVSTIVLLGTGGCYNSLGSSAAYSASISLHSARARSILCVRPRGKDYSVARCYPLSIAAKKVSKAQYAKLGFNEFPFNKTRQQSLCNLAQRDSREVIECSPRTSFKGYSPSRAGLRAVCGPRTRLLNRFQDSPAVPALLVFAEERAYRGFPRRLAKLFACASGAPRSSGYTLHGIATSYYDPNYGTLRPVYTHEFIHSLVALQTGIPNHGQWLHEGLAVRYQLRFHPQADLRAIVLKGMTDGSLHESLADLCTDAPIASNRYWQAMTVVEMLIEEESFAPHWQQLLAALSKRGSSDLSPHLAAILETDWEELETKWRDHCRRKYGPASE